MCYEMVSSQERIEYVCPKCQRKTLYVVDTFSVVNSITECRRLIREIKNKGLSVELDELEFCKKCRPKATSPQLILIVMYPQEKSVHRVKGIYADDLKLVLEFLKGMDRHIGSTYTETPLKDYLPKLQELLGVKLNGGGAK